MSPGNSDLKVSVVGCGWYGQPLAVHLRDSGWKVKGSKTTEAGVAALRHAGVEGYLLKLDPSPTNSVDPALFDSDVLIVNIPPRRRPDIEDFYIEQMRSLAGLVAGGSIERLVFISSTSVYPDINRVVKENDDLAPRKPAGRALRNAERLWREQPRTRTTIVRFGGLVGENRDPGRFLAGRTDVGNGDAPVNLIHLDDCLAITRRILEEGAWGETFNACAPRHPTRRDFYTAAAEKAGLAVPSFSNRPTTAYKQVDSTRLLQRLGYEFLYPDPMRFP